MNRATGIVVLLATVAVQPASARQTVTFRGKIHVAGRGPLPSQMKVRLGPFGTHVPNDGGFFAGAIPAETRSIALEVETGSPKWVVRYPLGPVAVPRDSAFVTDVIIGPSIEETLARAYAVENALLREHLKGAGLQDSLVIAALDGIRREFQDRTHLEAAALREAATRQNERLKEYPRLATAFEAYDIKAHNIRTAFTYILEPAFVSGAAFGVLRNAILEYNVAFESLRTQRKDFENVVHERWEGERVYSDVVGFMNYALATVHEGQVLPLNDLLPDINRVLRGQLNGGDAKRLRDAVTARVQTAVRDLDPLLKELGRLKDVALLRLQEP
ncbi:MAG: hypothetical protein HOP28_14120 [Gemmatimonadales bacterium]|nr:hypothetical protein [Gemmatimonadales bacterium]